MREQVRLSITFKILAGYIILAVLLGTASLVSIYLFYRIAGHPNSAASAQLDVLSTAERLQASLVQLDRYRRKALETDSRELLNLFNDHDLDFDQALRDLAVKKVEPRLVGQITARSDLYRRLFAEQVDRMRRGKEEQSVEPSANELQKQVDHLSSLVAELVVRARSGLDERYRLIPSFSRRAAWLVLFLTLVGSGVGLVVVFAAARYLSVSLGKLKKATNLIGEGVFDVDSEILSGDEIGDLSRSLTVMAQKLKGYEQLCLDASPLTRLPGNIAIERALLERIRRSEKFALCYADLDDFKAYNDKYGYAKGSEVIKGTGEILYETKRMCGGPDDFIGHIGGDDFVLITSPENVTNVCEFIIREFDRLIPEFYSAEDQGRGFIEGVDHFGVARQFPIMTISIAVVSDVRRNIESPTEIAKVAAEIKEFVKDLPGSNYLVDRRREPRNNSRRPSCCPG